MADGKGKLRLTVPGGTSYSFGTITGISESFQKSVSTTPIPSVGVDRTFSIESKTTKVISISFVREAPSSTNDNGSDPSRWSNGTWVRNMEAQVSRWQCKTDGFQLTYEPSSDNPYIAPIDENGYVKDLTIDYSEGTPTKLKGSLEFHVGTMYVGSKAPVTDVTSRPQAQFQMLMFNPNGTPAIILKEGEGCVDSYSLYGGPETPFEYARIRIPKKKLKENAPQFFTDTECTIKPGVTKLTVNAVGSSSMTVSKVKLDNDTYTLTAYCDAEMLRGCVLEKDKTMSAEAWVNSILSGGSYGMVFNDERIIRKYDQTLDTKMGNLSFRSGTNIWYILQVCAMCLGAKVFFADNKAYVVDFRSIGDGLRDYGAIDLHPSGGNELYAMATTGNVDLGDEGVDTIINAATVTCTTNTADAKVTKTYTYTYRDDPSIKVYKERSGNNIVIKELMQTDPELEVGKGESDLEYGVVTNGGLTLDISGVRTEFEEGDTFSYTGLKVSYLDDEDNTVQVSPSDCDITAPLMNATGVQSVKVSYTPPEGKTLSASYTVLVKVRQYGQAEYFAQSYVDYRKEPQQSVSFTMKEMRMVDGRPTWVPYFGPLAAASRIKDDTDDVYVDNISDIDGKPCVQKLTLSSYERRYPSGQTSYTWGVMSSIDLSSSTSQITTNLSNVNN